LQEFKAFSAVKLNQTRRVLFGYFNGSQSTRAEATVSINPNATLQKFNSAPWAGINSDVENSIVNARYKIIRSASIPEFPFKKWRY
jgi:hypothetical protein